MRGVRKSILLGGVAAAITALGIGFLPPFFRYKALADLHEGAAHPGFEMRPDTPSVRASIAYHEALARKYRRASFLPWFPVSPDPPEPVFPE